MSMFNATECKEAAETVRGAFYLAPSVMNTCSAIISIFVFWLIYDQYHLRIYYHVNAKITIGINMVSFLLLSIASILAYGSVFINAALAVEDCDYFFKTSSCSPLRRTFLFSILLTTLTHVSLVLERAYATHKLGKYERIGPTLGVTAGIVSVSISVVIVDIITSFENESELLTNCLAFSSADSISEGVYDMFRFVFILEVLTWIIYFYLMNHHRKRCVREETEGNLGDRYQLTENQTILRHIGPLVLTSSAIIACYILTASTARLFRPHFTLPHYKQFLSCIFVMPHNSLISMTLYYFLFKWSFQEKKRRMEDTLNSPRNQKKNYYEQLNEFWNDSYKKKNEKSPRSFFALADKLDA